MANPPSNAVIVFDGKNEDHGAPTSHAPALSSPETCARSRIQALQAMYTSQTNNVSLLLRLIGRHIRNGEYQVAPLSLNTQISIAPEQGCCWLSRRRKVV